MQLMVEDKYKRIMKAVYECRLLQLFYIIKI